MGGRREGEAKRVPCLKRPAHRPLKGVTGVCEGKNEFFIIIIYSPPVGKIEKTINVGMS